jgi:hypothetical protein
MFDQDAVRRPRQQFGLGGLHGPAAAAAMDLHVRHSVCATFNVCHVQWASGQWLHDGRTLAETPRFSCLLARVPTSTGTRAWQQR